jgi:hypothetical protein
VNAATTLIAVDGGWSPWMSTGESICGGSGCSACSITGQIAMRVEIRKCNTPYTNNGGKDCIGSNVRGILCSTTACTGSALIDKTTFERNQCAATYSFSIPGGQTECSFACYIDSKFQGLFVCCLLFNGTLQDVCGIRTAWHVRISNQQKQDVVLMVCNINTTQ